MNPPQDRPRYRPSGRLEPVAFLLVSAVALGAALLAGYVLHLSTHLTFPGAAIGPLLAGIPVAGAVAIAVQVGRCRNPSVGAVLGVWAGAFLFFGAFQFRAAAAHGDEHFFRVDLLPQRIDEHVHDDALWADAGRGRPRVRAPASPGAIAFRWSLLGIGFMAAALGPVSAGWLSGARPFSEGHGRWLKAWTTRLTRESGQVVADALSRGSAEALRGAISPIPPGEKTNPAVGFAHLVVEYLPGEADTPVYLSVGIMTPTGAKRTIMPNWLVSRWELTPAEAAAVAEALPVPDAAFGTPKSGTRPGDRVATAIAARVVPLTDQDAGLILSRANVWVATVIGLAPLALGFGLGVAAGVAAAVYAADLLPAEMAALIAGGVVAVVASLAWIVLYADYLPSKFFHARARRVIADRPDPCVQPDDPDAVFVQIVPRSNWGHVMLENAEDVGFLLLDAARGVILYEGDRQRWVIPRESVVSFELEAFDVGPSDPNAGPAFWLVVLKANVGGSVWEAPVAPRPTRFERSTPATRRRAAEDLRDRIARTLGTG